jgi:hypothetical protein
VVDLLLNGLFIYHIIVPQPKYLELGAPYVLSRPGLVFVQPLIIVLAILFGSTSMMVTFSLMNSTLILLTYPLTIAAIIYFKMPLFYIGVIAALILNKVPMSISGCKVRANLENPSFRHSDILLSKVYDDLREKSTLERARAAAMPRLARLIARHQAGKVHRLLAEQKNKIVSKTESA